MPPAARRQPGARALFVTLYWCAGGSGGGGGGDRRTGTGLLVGMPVDTSSWPIRDRPKGGGRKAGWSVYIAVPVTSRMLGVGRVGYLRWTAERKLSVVYLRRGSIVSDNVGSADW